MLLRTHPDVGDHHLREESVPVVEEELLLTDGQEDRYQGNVCLQERGKIVYTLAQKRVHSYCMYTCVGARNIFYMLVCT